MHILVAVIKVSKIFCLFSCYVFCLMNVCFCFCAPNSHLFREAPAEAAARECAEETMGVLGTKDHLLQSLRNYEQNNVFKVSTVAD